MLQIVRLGSSAAASRTQKRLAPMLTMWVCTLLVAQGCGAASPAGTGEQEQDATPQLGKRDAARTDRSPSGERGESTGEETGAVSVEDSGRRPVDSANGAAPKMKGVAGQELDGGLDLASAVSGSFPDRTRKEALADLTPIWTGYPAPTEFCVAGDHLWVAAGLDAIGSRSSLSHFDLKGEHRSTLAQELGRVDAVSCESDRILWVERPSVARSSPSVRSFTAASTDATTLVESKEIAYGFAAFGDTFAYALPPRERGTVGGLVLGSVAAPEGSATLGEDLGPVAGLTYAASGLVIWSKTFTGEDRLTQVRPDKTLAPFARGKMAVLSMSALADALTLLVLDDDGRGCRLVRTNLSDGMNAQLTPIWHSRDRVYGTIVAAERGVFLASSPADQTGELIYVPYDSGEVVVLAKVARAWRLARASGGVVLEYDLSEDMRQAKRALTIVGEPPA